MFLVNSIWSQEQQQQQQERDTMREMLLEDLEIAMKIVIVGNGSVGKSSMIQRFCRGIFTRDYKKTIGVDFLERILTIDEQAVRLMLWDTAGQEEFDAITRTYYRGANACVLACSVTDRDSFLALPKWKTKVTKEISVDIPMVLVANKVDLQKQAVVDSSDLENMARQLGIKKIFRTSVKEDLNVTSVFTHLAQSYVQTVISLTAEDAADEEYLLPSHADEDTHNIHRSSYPLFGNNNKTKNKKITSSNGTNNNKGIFRSPVILKTGVNHHLHHGHLQTNQRGFFSSAKNKILISHQNHHSRKNNHSSNGNGLAIDRLSYPFAPPANGHSHHNHHNHHHGPRWMDTGKYDNMPFRLDLVKGQGSGFAKKRRREICNIL